MKSKIFAVLATVVLAATAAPAVLAQKASEPLQSQLSARKVVVVEGRESLVDAANAKPGDVIEYAATYRNTGKAALRNLEATLPIPANTEFIEGSARPVTARASTDGASFNPMPLKRKVRTAAGVEVEQPVPLSEYRALRWYPGALAGEATVTFTARVKVSDDRSPPPAPAKGGGK